MTAVNILTISERLQKLREIIDKLEQHRKTSRADFMVDYTVSDAAMHNLVMGVEIIVDIGNHILSEKFQTKASEYAEVVKKLGEVGVVPKQFAEGNANMAGFRNLIIHQYIDIDLGKVFDYLQKAPEIFREFAKHFAEFLDKRSS